MLRGPLAPRTLPSASSRTWTCGCWASRCGIWSTGISSTRQARGIYFGPPPPHTPKLIFFSSRDVQIFFCLHFPPFACIYLSIFTLSVLVPSFSVTFPHSSFYLLIFVPKWQDNIPYLYTPVRQGCHQEKSADSAASQKIRSPGTRLCRDVITKFLCFDEFVTGLVLHHICI